MAKIVLSQDPPLGCIILKFHMVKRAWFDQLVGPLSSPFQYRPNTRTFWKLFVWQEVHRALGFWSSKQTPINTLPPTRLLTLSCSGPILDTNLDIFLRLCRLFDQFTSFTSFAQADISSACHSSTSCCYFALQNFHFTYQHLRQFAFQLFFPRPLVGDKLLDHSGLSKRR